jgi:hypothetical protein
VNVDIDLNSVEKMIEKKLKNLIGEIIELDKYEKEIETVGQDCVYEYDDNPDVISSKNIKDKDIYIEYENARDFLYCKNFIARIDTQRIYINAEKLELILLLDVDEVSVERDYDYEDYVPDWDDNTEWASG